LGDHLHVVHQTALLIDFLLIGLHGCFPRQFHLDLPPLLAFHLLVLVLLLLLFLPGFILALVPHVHLQVLHSPLFLLDLFIELLLLAQDGSYVQLDVDL
jgi:hypothetical protein